MTDDDEKVNNYSVDPAFDEFDLDDILVEVTKDVS